MPYSLNIAGGNLHKCEVTWRAEGSASVILCVAHSIQFLLQNKSMMMMMSANLSASLYQWLKSQK